jgi:hypothetical protein
MIDPFIMAMDSISNSNNKNLGENGSPQYTAEGVNDHILTLFFSLVRNIPDERLYHFMKNIIDTRDLKIISNLIILTFQTRNCRGGKGEKLLFYKMFLKLYETYPQTMISCLPLIKKYGYFKDYFLMLELSEPNFIPLHIGIIKILVKQIKDDIKELSQGSKSISLCAKYMPRENHHFSSKKNRRFFTMLVKELIGGITNHHLKIYRTEFIVPLTKYLDITENYMASKRFDEINFEKVPSRCLNISRKAFMNELVKGYLSEHMYETGNRHPTDITRITCRNNLIKALIDEKINGKQIQPHELTQQIISASSLEIKLLEAQWNKILENVKSSLTDIKKEAIDLGKVVPMIDVSGSMNGIPLEVAVALGIMVSELTISTFRHRVLSFTNEANWINMSECKNLRERVNLVRSAPWGSNTNIIVAFKRIIDALRSIENLTQDDVPNLLILSDMQFDAAFTDGISHSDSAENFNWKTTYDIIKEMFLELGQEKGIDNLLPSNVVFWNLRGDTDGYPTDGHEEGIQMLSGYSPSLLKLLLNGEPIILETTDENGEKIKIKKTPIETVLKILNDELYDPVREIINKSSELNN